jgi:hypothetical protein
MPESPGTRVAFANNAYDLMDSPGADAKTQGLSFFSAAVSGLPRRVD